VNLAFDRKGAGPPLVLLHGVGHRRQAWDSVVELVAPQRELILVDLPGHGESPPLELDGQPVVQALLRAVTGLLDDLGLERPNVAGNSLGGLLALEAGVAGRASTVTALSPAGFFRGKADVVKARGVFRTMQTAGRLLQPMAPTLARSAGGRALLYGAIVNRPSLLSPEQALADMKAFLAAKEALEVIMEGVGQFSGSVPPEVPVTIAWGNKDRLLSPKQSSVARDQLPEANFVLLPGCGHVPMTDDPRLVARVLLHGSVPAPGAQTG
jgi:pimeloyl-ACP methyl ester carboxylesterase